MESFYEPTGKHFVKDKGAAEPFIPALHPSYTDLTPYLHHFYINANNEEKFSIFHKNKEK